MSTEPIGLTAFAVSPVALPVDSSSHWRATSCLVATDFLALSLVFGLSVAVRHLITSSYPLNSFFELIPFIFMMIGGLWIQGLYPGALLHPADEMRRICVSLTTVFLVMTCTTFLWRTENDYSRSVFLVTWFAGTPLVMLMRHIARTAWARHEGWGIPAIVLGSGTSAQRVLRILQNNKRGVRVVGVLSDDSSALTWPSDLPPILGPIKLAPSLAAAGAAQYVIVATSQTSNREIRSTIENYCFGFGHVLLIPDMPGLCSMGVSARELGGEIGLELPQRLFHRGSATIKRILDVVITSVAIIIFSPLFLIIAGLVRMSSKGGVLYKQLRYGRNGRTFHALKFRTMVPDAEKILAHHLATHPEDLFEWQRDHKLKNDPRVTGVGKWLRKLSLDELPQLFNVLVGQMSLVGPRPIVNSEIEKYGRGYILYSRVLPGITGLWQVSGRNNTTYQERVALDEFYVNNWSVWLDTYILIRTIRVVITSEGAY